MYIIDKCKDQPKLFYRYVIGKLNHREDISKLKINGKVYEDEIEMAELTSLNREKWNSRYAEIQRGNTVNPRYNESIEGKGLTLCPKVRYI